MDTSKQYIKMSDCPEMQDGWVSKIGDITNEGMAYVIARLGYIAITPQGAKGQDVVDFFKQADLIFLRSQPQLQDMVADYECYKDSNLTGLVGDLYGFALHNNINFLFKTMEQLWLAFVMWELHSKQWVDGKWETTGQN